MTNYNKFETRQLTITTAKPTHIEDFLTEFWFMFTEGFQYDDHTMIVTGLRADMEKAVCDGLDDLARLFGHEVEQMKAQIANF